MITTKSEREREQIDQVFNLIRDVYEISGEEQPAFTNAEVRAALRDTGTAARGDAPGQPLRPYRPVDAG